MSSSQAHLPLFLPTLPILRRFPHCCYCPLLTPKGFQAFLSLQTGQVASISAWIRIERESEMPALATGPFHTKLPSTGAAVVARGGATFLQSSPVADALQP